MQFAYIVWLNVFCNIVLLLYFAYLFGINKRLFIPFVLCTVGGCLPFAERWLTLKSAWPTFFIWLSSLWIVFAALLCILIIIFLTVLLFSKPIGKIFKKTFLFNLKKTSFTLIGISFLTIAYGAYEALSPRIVHFNIVTNKLISSETATEEMPNIKGTVKRTIKTAIEKEIKKTVEKAASKLGVKENIQANIQANIQVNEQVGRQSLGYKKLRIVFVSDLHINPRIGENTFKKIVSLINSQDADIVLFGGDIVDCNLKDYPNAVSIFNELKAKNKFAVLGNHEMIYGIKQAEDFFEKTNIKLLRHDFVKTNGIVIVGLDDPLIAAKEKTKNHWAVPLLKKVNSLDNSFFVILLKHRPAIIKNAIGYFDLQLSGQTHGGQLFLVKLALDYLGGEKSGLSEYRFKDNIYNVFVSVGTGFSRWPLRIMVPPEVVVIDVVSKL